MSDPKSREAAVVPWNAESPLATLGNKMMLHCRAVGWPRPTVTWWRGTDMLPFTSERFEQFRDGSMIIRVVTLRSLGPYTCQVYNGYGRATSQTTILRALGPVNSIPSDRNFLQYIVEPPRAPPTSPPKTKVFTTHFPAVRPNQRPYWPSHVPPLLPETTQAPTTKAFIGEVLYAFTMYKCNFILKYISVK